MNPIIRTDLRPAALSVGSTLVLALAVATSSCGDDDDTSPSAGTGGRYAPYYTSGTGGVQPRGILCGYTYCTENQKCRNSVCVDSCRDDSNCAAGYSCCDSICIPTSVDRNNCGACGRVCANTEDCTNGECIPLVCTTPDPPGGDPDAVTDRDAAVSPDAASKQDAPVATDDDAGVETDDDAGVETDDDAGVEDDGDNVPDAGGGGGSSNSVVLGSNGCPLNELCVYHPAGKKCMCGSNPGCPLDQSCSASGQCMCGTSPGCTTGQSCCGNTCADLQTDTDSCGSCGAKCSTGTSCQAGVCVCSVASQTPCPAGCADLQTDLGNCGACGNACAEGASCVAGDCRCPDGEIACEEEVSGQPVLTCVTADTDEHCGDCDTRCTGPTTCKETDDFPLGCYCSNFKHVACGDVCVDTDTNTSHCGRCDNACTSPTSVCRDDECNCPVEGEVACGDACYDPQVGHFDGDAYTHCGACGATCLSDTVCVGGTCPCPTDPPYNFPEDYLFCDEDPDLGGATDGAYECVDAANDFNCYACGNACLDTSRCDSTAEACVCDDAIKNTYCDDKCVDPNTDEDHCGGCHLKCPDAVVCTGGECLCPNAGEKACPVSGKLECIDVLADIDNCGSCRNDCDAEQACCDGVCVGITDDVNNCGSCGKDCPPPNAPCGGLFQPACETPTCTNGVCG